ncbi:hypothetical protein N656DRAFT_784370 [Canariomyces notabilis]|uniref:Cytochrome b5 heme-binding domain-containing protein n=1 Tax=Canariomyces notabilis TaxID=2074819 RepID=A0AAN6T7S8_9PEZI|nr:hypothetical protein N656DRAFT_784370 [Canariomyces arenarius]
MRRPAWLPSIFRASPPARLASSAEETRRDEGNTEHDLADRGDGIDAETVSYGSERPTDEIPLAIQKPTADQTALPPTLVLQQEEPEVDASDHNTLGDSPSANSACDGQATPKASASAVTNAKPVPALQLDPLSSSEPPIIPSLNPVPALAEPSPSASTLMPPPPPPPPRRPPTLRPTPNNNTNTTNNLPIPTRGPGCSTLAPPPSHSSKPTKPSRQVVLSPGHSPLDWARLTASPAAADSLRGLPAGTPYLRVTPSMLKRQTGRKGKDAWTVLGGRVYNITPYLPFHPGGEPELLRGAGRDGTRLFGEVHPWVNYEGMLAACLVGIYVSEEEGGEGGKGDMEAMD